MNLFFINTRGLRFGRSLVETSGKVQSAILLSVPLFHATGCHSVMVGNIGAGGKIVMMHHFDPERALELIERERITTFGGVPAMVMQVLDSPASPSTTPRPSAVSPTAVHPRPRTWSAGSGTPGRSGSRPTATG
jgi:acyl-CoA synthetase (AMP-forming)/AMP-acid ligase II